MSVFDDIKQGLKEAIEYEGGEIPLDPKYNIYDTICASAINILRVRNCMPKYALSGFNSKNKGHLCLVEWCHIANLLNNTTQPIYIDCGWWSWRKLHKKYNELKRGKKFENTINCDKFLEKIKLFVSDTLPGALNADLDDLYNEYYNY